MPLLKPPFSFRVAGALLCVGFFAFSFEARSASFEYRFPIQGLKAKTPTPAESAEQLSFSLTERAPFSATKGQYFAFDLNELLQMSGEPQPAASAVQWVLGEAGSALPAGLSLVNNGLLSGTPVVSGDSDFEVRASYGVASANRVYRIVVGGVELRVTQLSAGSGHTCAITIDGAAKCWGFNGQGQLGDGTTQERPTPVDVFGLQSGVTFISAGANHTCAVVNGGVKCWGVGSSGQLGNGTTTNAQTTPVDVSGMSSGVASVSAGSYTCAVTTLGAARCWGSTVNGQLGNGDTSGKTQSTPVPVTGLQSGVSLISVGFNHACAIVNGGAKCWGRGQFGQLGYGGTSTIASPIDVSGLTNGVSLISSGYYHTCAVTTAGTAKCWGHAGDGRLGDGQKSFNRTTPVDVIGLGSATVTSIVADSQNTCAITSGGVAKCWGVGSSGQLGNGAIIGEMIPVEVSGLQGGVVALTVGALHACAISTDGIAKCWGNGTFGRLGNGAADNQTTPVELVWE